MDPLRNVRLPLLKYLQASGERRVRVSDDGKAAHTVFRLLARWERFSLLEAELKTGRTHQIRVHLAHLGYPIAGDEKYGDFALNKGLSREGLKRMFLHASRMRLPHPLDGTEMLLVEAALPAALQVSCSNVSAKESRIMARRFELLVSTGMARCSTRRGRSSTPSMRLQ
jgi:23S rRNA pseudouridine955/2504/2580 synthase